MPDAWPDSRPGWRGVRQSHAGVIMARDMVNEPANHMTPTTIAGLATEMASELGLKIEVLEKAGMADLGMGILLAVAAESEQPPKFIILEHNADRADLPTVVLCGKGVTFDRAASPSSRLKTCGA